MAIDLLGIQPHKVSRDLSGYITFIYGPAKVGKTTFGSKMPGHLILAFERGYNALPGVMIQDVTSWGEMKQIVRELKKPEVKEVYKSIIIDTVDVAADACQKYICNQLGIENIGDGGWANNGWTKYKKEFEQHVKNFGYGFIKQPEELIPPVDLTYWAFRIMVGCGLYIFLVFIVNLYYSYKNSIQTSKWVNYATFIAVPMVYIAGQCGWIVAEVGRQPWAIQDLLPVGVAVSQLNQTDVITTFAIFAILFTILLIVELRIMLKAIATFNFE